MRFENPYPAITSGFLRLFVERGANSSLERSEVSDVLDPDTKYFFLVENPSRGGKVVIVCLALIAALVHLDYFGWEYSS